MWGMEVLLQMGGGEPGMGGGGGGFIMGGWEIFSLLT